MAKKKQASNKIETRADEVIISSLDPKELTGKYLTKNLCRTWTEEFIDQDTNEKVTVKRSEIILNKGTLLGNDTMSTVLFHMQTGDITEPIEVSNQHRLGTEIEHTRATPYCAKVVFGGSETKKYLLEASSIRQVLDILTDYCELNATQQFTFTEVKEYNCSVILVDMLRNLTPDEAAEKYVQGIIPFEEFMDQVIEDEEYDKPTKDEPDNVPVKFYEIKAAIAYDGERSSNIDSQPFIVVAADADRAILTINAWLQARQRDSNARHIKNNELDEVDNRAITATIEESKIVNFSKLIPKQFCMAYTDKK